MSSWLKTTIDVACIAAGYYLAGWIFDAKWSTAGFALTVAITAIHYNNLRNKGAN
jgi:hypothetical protein